MVLAKYSQQPKQGTFRATEEIILYPGCQLVLGIEVL